MEALHTLEALVVLLLLPRPQLHLLPLHTQSHMQQAVLHSPWGDVLFEAKLLQL